MKENNVTHLNIVFIKKGDIEIGLLPELGGTIAFAKYKNLDFMRAWTGELTPRRTCCYPLVPFSNRIANGQFSFAGRSYQLAKNFADHPHTIHGIAWQKPWEIIEHLQDKIILGYQHRPDIDGIEGWPFSFSVMQTVEIFENSLLVKMDITNNDSCDIPVGFGWHPFFPRHDDVLLQFDAEQVVINNDNMLPEKIIDIPNDWNYHKLKQLGEPNLDNCFVNWNRKAIIKWPTKKLSLTLTATTPLAYLVVMTPSAPMNTFFAVEPVSHINNAINSNTPLHNGIQVLASNQTLTGEMQMQLDEIN